MAYLVQETDPNTITVTYTGSVDIHERKAAVGETCKLINPSNPVRLLIDVTKIIMKMSVDEQKSFAEYLTSKKELANAKIAVLHDPQSNPNLIINALVYTKGFFTVNFENKNEAIAWLNGDLK